MPSVYDAIPETETVSRFLFDRGDFTPSTGRVKPRPFLPGADGLTSVFRIDGLPGNHVWSLARPRGERHVRARGDTIVRHVRRVGLTVVVDEPPERHANIGGWPAKDARLALAQELAAIATLVVREAQVNE